MLSTDESFMQEALELAKLGQGNVEPNPMVGCVLVCDGEIVGRGFHEMFGGAHAEVNAIADAKRKDSRFSSEAASPFPPLVAYVTLEPCAHTGKTGPCCEALIEAAVSKVVIACVDPNPLVAGKGIARLQEAGIEVVAGVLEAESRKVLGPFLKRMEKKKPWIIAKWAMTLDGKIATATGDSKWISNEDSRAIVHQIRSRVDAIMVGIGTVLADDPMLNVRLESHELSSPNRSPALRVVCDSTARTPLDSKLVATAREIPTLIAVGPDASAEHCEQLRIAGCEVFESRLIDRAERLDELLGYLNEQQITNVLVEGGGQLLGSLNDVGQIDEVHCFVAPKVIGGNDSLSPILGRGFPLVKAALEIEIESVQQVGSDIYVFALTSCKS